jgi:HAE1 family hydrophobic/amphiphilic exporter-1
MSGFEILSEGTGSNSGTCLINLKNWDERKHSVTEVMKELEEKTKDIKGATIECFPPPAVPGYGAAGGFELRVLDKSGSGDYKKMETVSQDFVKELNKRPELTSVFHFL